MMKKVLFLVTYLAALSADPLVEPLTEDLVIEAAPLPEARASSAILMPPEEIEFSAENPPLEPAEGVQPVQISKPAPFMIPHPEEDIAAIIQEEKEVAEDVANSGIVIDLGQVFAGSPTIYSVLFGLSIASLGIWIYTFLSLRDKEIFSTPQQLREEIQAQKYDSALKICEENPSLLFNMVGAALKNRDQGNSTMLEMMQGEGRRTSTSYWQKIGLLNEIAIIAPMLGLLGTVLGMFYAFYDLNRSAESISALFDGLGISVGTTVGGLVVALLALLLHAIAKYRLMRQLTMVEKEAESLVQSIKGKL